MHAPMSPYGTVTPAPGVYAGFWRRVGAVIIDAIVLWVIGEVLAAVGVGESIFTLQENVEATPTVSDSIVSTAITWVYFIVLNGMGATVGKRLFGMRVIDEQGRPPGIRRGVIRYLIPGLGSILFLLAMGGLGASDPADVDSVLVTLGIGVVVIFAASLFSLYDGLSMLWHPRRQTLHDRMADTFVVMARSLRPTGSHA